MDEQWLTVCVCVYMAVSAYSLCMLVFITVILLQLCVKMHLHLRLLWQNLHHPGVVNLQEMFDTPVKVHFNELCSITRCKTAD